MRLTHSCTALLCVLYVWTLHWHAHAQQGPGDPKNAATWYQKAIDQMDRLTVDEWNTILFTLNEPHELKLTPDLRAALAKAAPIISDFQRGAQQEFSDFAPDYSQGIELTLPHLTQLRQMARILTVDAMVRIHDGDAAGAAERLAHVYRSAAHYGDDQIVISSLVGQHTFTIADGGVQHAIDRGALAGDAASDLLHEVQRLADMGDPFNYTGAAAMEQEMMVGWLRTQRGDPESVERLMELYLDMGEEQAWAESIMSMPDADFDAAIAQYEHVTERVVEIMSIEDHDVARAEMAVLEAEIMAGEHGPLIHMMPAWGHVLKRKIAADEAVAKRIESLRALASGEVEPEELVNAALWYLRAFSMLEKWEPERLDVLRAFAVDSEVDADDDEASPGRALERELRRSQEIVDVLREGSLFQRCDFSIAPSDRADIAPGYAGGMRDALRLVHADALRLARAGQRAEAADRLAVGYRMIAHFSGAGHFACSILSHRALLEAHELLQRVTEGARLAEEDFDALAASLDRIDLSDPFGYVASRRASMERLRAMAERFDRVAATTERELLGRWPDLVEAIALAHQLVPLTTNVEVVRDADDDALLFYLAIVRFYNRPTSEHLGVELAEEAIEAERELWAALHDVFDLDELSATMVEAPHTAGDRAFNRSRRVLHNLDVRTLNLLADRRHRAGADLRATASLLHERSAPPETPAED